MPIMADYYHGLNVTVPHKQTVMKYLKDIDETAADIGAVNTLVRMEGGYKGYNTDVPGLLRSIQEEGIVIKDRACILIGAGGAGKAAAYMMAKEGASVIYLLNRSKEKAMQDVYKRQEIIRCCCLLTAGVSEWSWIAIRVLS